MQLSFSMFFQCTDKQPVSIKLRVRYIQKIDRDENQENAFL